MTNPNYRRCIVAYLDGMYPSGHLRQAQVNALREEKPAVMVQDWYKDQQSQTRVKSAIEEVLDKNLPDGYDRLTFKQVCDRIYNLIFERAVQGLAWGM